MDPKGKVALITGGARIGQAVAQALAARDCRLALVYRNTRPEGGLALQADITNESQVKAAIAETVKTFGRLDILINMASGYDQTPDPAAADWDKAMDVAAKGSFLFSTHAAPHLRAHGAGRIINIGDWLPASGRPRYKGYAPYYAAKAAVHALSESLALEYAPDILVNTIAPGPVLPPPGLSEAENTEVLAETPLARWGGAEEIAKAVLFLIESDFITGECLRVDGGRHLY